MRTLAVMKAIASHDGTSPSCVVGETNEANNKKTLVITITP
jgi:hypothetical protein